MEVVVVAVVVVVVESHTTNFTTTIEYLLMAVEEGLHVEVGSVL